RAGRETPAAPVRWSPCAPDPQIRSEARLRATPLRSGRRPSSLGSREGAAHDRARLLLNPPQVIGSPETLRVELVDRLGSGGARGEPSRRCRDLQAAYGCAIAGRCCQHGLNRIAGEGGGGDVGWRELQKPRLLILGYRCVEALIYRIADLIRQLL